MRPDNGGGAVLVDAVLVDTDTGGGAGGVTVRADAGGGAVLVGGGGGGAVRVVTVAGGGALVGVDGTLKTLDSFDFFLGGVALLSGASWAGSVCARASSVSKYCIKKLLNKKKKLALHDDKNLLFKLRDFINRQKSI